jgi:hypothetical protein
MRPSRFLLVVGLASCSGAQEAQRAPEPRREPVALRDTSGGPIAPDETRVPISPPEPPPEPAANERFTARTLGAAPPARPRGRTIDLDVRGADIQDVCRLLADVGHVNIVVSDDVHGTVTVKMHDVPWDQALQAILLSKGLRTVEEANVIVVQASAK